MHNTKGSQKSIAAADYFRMREREPPKHAALK